MAQENQDMEAADALNVETTINPTPVPGPATADSQQETERALEFQKAVDQIKRNSGADDMQAQEAAVEMLQSRKLAEEQRAKELEAQQAAEQQVKQQQLDQRLVKYEAAKLNAAELGVPFQPNPEFESALNGRKQQLVTDAIKSSPDVQAAEAATPSQAEIEANAQPVRQALAQQQGQIQALAEQEQRALQRQQDIQEQINREDESLAQINPNRYWENKTTGQKILAGLAVFLGGFGKGGNQALNIINNAIEKDIESQKLNNQQKLAKLQNAYKMVQLQLDQIGAKTKNEMQQLKLQELKQNMFMKQQEYMQKRQTQMLLGSGEGVNPEIISALDPKDQARAVPVGDKVYFALSAGDATKLRQDIVPNAKNAIEAIKGLKEISDKPFGGALSLEQRAKADVFAQTLVGSLRLELFGPGAFTDTEQKLARKLIGDPTSLTSLNSVERSKLDTLMNKIVQGTRDKLRSSGVKLPKSQNEINIEKVQNANPKMKRPDIINALIKVGKWQQESF